MARRLEFGEPPSQVVETAAEAPAVIEVVRVEAGKVRRDHRLDVVAGKEHRLAGDKELRGAQVGCWDAQTERRDQREHSSHLSPPASKRRGRTGAHAPSARHETVKR